MLLIAIVLLSAPQAAWLYTLGAIVAASGVTFRLWAAGYLRKDDELAQDGPYALVRHPLYVGNFLIIGGYLLAAQVTWLIPAAVVFAILYYPPAIHKEDAKLRRKFPEQWASWATRAPALIPTATPSRPFHLTNWSFQQSLKANGEPIIAGLIALGMAAMGLRLG